MTTKKQTKEKRIAKLQRDAQWRERNHLKRCELLMPDKTIEQLKRQSSLLNCSASTLNAVALIDFFGRLQDDEKARNAVAKFIAELKNTSGISTELYPVDVVEDAQPSPGQVEQTQAYDFNSLLQ